jgi:hypothetical protein
VVLGEPVAVGVTQAVALEAVADDAGDGDVVELRLDPQAAVPAMTAITMARRRACIPRTCMRAT